MYLFEQSDLFLSERHLVFCLISILAVCVQGVDVKKTTYIFLNFS